jgi:hypothetical protein
MLIRCESRYLGVLKRPLLSGPSMTQGPRFGASGLIRAPQWSRKKLPECSTLPPPFAQHSTTAMSGSGPTDFVQCLPSRQLLGVKRTYYARREIFRI